MEANIPRVLIFSLPTNEEQYKRISKIYNKLKRSSINAEMLDHCFNHHLWMDPREDSIPLLCMTSKFAKDFKLEFPKDDPCPLGLQLIPLLMEKKFEPSGKLYSLVKNKRQIDFTDDSEFSKKMEELKKEINRLLIIQEKEIAIGSSGGDFPIKELNLSLKVPENAVQKDVSLVIHAFKMSLVDLPEPCAYGETLLSYVLKFSTADIEFKKPVQVSISYDIAEIPKRSSIVMKSYDNKQGKWMSLDHCKDGRNKITARVSELSFIAACTSMDKETHTFSKDASSYSPFNSIYTIQLGFKEKEVDETELEFNMKEFSEIAINELKQRRLRPLPALFVKEKVNEKNKEQQSKSITILNQQYQEGEKMIILFRNGDGECEEVHYTVEENSVKFDLQFTSGTFLPYIELKEFEYAQYKALVDVPRPCIKHEEYFEKKKFYSLYRFLWPFKVDIKLCGKREQREEKFCIGCYRPIHSARFENAMKDEGYSTCISHRNILFPETQLTFQFNGCYRVSEIVSLRFEYINFVKTSAFSRELLDANLGSNLVITKPGVPNSWVELPVRSIAGQLEGDP